MSRERWRGATGGDFRGLDSSVDEPAVLDGGSRTRHHCGCCVSLRVTAARDAGRHCPSEGTVKRSGSGDRRVRLHAERMHGSSVRLTQQLL